MNLHVRNIVSAETGEALVDLLLDDTQIAQMTLAQARAHAQIVIECAEAAEQDAFMVHFIRDVWGASWSEEEKLRMIAYLINEYRKWRATYRALNDAGVAGG